MPVPTQATISPTSGAAPLNCTGSLTGGFSNSWTGTYWDWGDGSPTTSVSYPFTSNHTYSTPGTFVAQFHFVAFSIPGTLSTPNITVTGGVASFTFSPASPTVGQTVTFTSTSTGATSYLWNFGDGNTSTLQNPTHAFSTANTFSVSLTINGGVSTVSHSVTTTPVAGFTFSPASPTIIDTVNFTDTSLGATSWFWDFGDGYTSSVQNPVHQYSTPNTYSVFLSINGGASTITNPITVAGVAPVASFTYDPLNFVSNQTVNFTDTSSYFPTSWQWDFGDGNTSTLQNPSHAYSGAGKFEIP